MIATVEDLPSELLRRIFRTCYESQPHSPTRIPSPTKTVERVLSQVSGRWRAVACDMPYLWSCVVVDLTRALSHEWAHTEQTQTYISRSKDGGLVVYWRYMMHDDSPLAPDTRYWELVQSTIDQSSKWLSLHIETNTAVARNTFVSRLFQLPVPRLTTFSFSGNPLVDGPNTNSVSHEPRPPFSIDNAPCLSRLELSSQDPRSIVLSGNTISTLVLTLTVFINYSELGQMLQSLPYLQILVLNQPAKNAFSFKRPLTNTVLPRLRMLVISAATQQRNQLPLFICLKLRAPNLRSLHAIGHLEYDASCLLEPIENSHQSPSPLPLYPNLQTFDFRPLRYDRHHAPSSFFPPRAFSSTIVNLIVQGNKMEDWLLDPATERALQALRAITLYCGTPMDPFDFDHEQPRCSCDGVRLLRKFVELRVGHGDLPLPRLRISVRCLRGNLVDGEWLGGMVEAEMLPECPDEPWDETLGNCEGEV